MTSSQFESDAVPSVNQKIKAIQDQVRKTAALPLKQAMTLPAQAYIDPDYDAWEREHVLKRDWQCVAHVSQVAHIGDYLCLDLLDEPLVVIRGKDHQVRVLSRVCPHRGMDIFPPPPSSSSAQSSSPQATSQSSNIVESQISDSPAYELGGKHMLPQVNPEPTPGRPQRGNRRVLVCPYHTWTFGLDGRVRGCPEMHQAEGFCKDNQGLAHIHTELWNGFIFVNLAGQASPLSQRLSKLDEVVADWQIQDLVVAIEDEWECEFGWKTLVENWIESYHHVGAHAKTLQPMMPAKNTWTWPQQSHFIYCHLPFTEAIQKRIRQADQDGVQPEPKGLWNIPGVPIEKRLQWHLFVGLPTFLFLCDRDRVIWYRLQPTGTGSMKLLTTTLVHPDNLNREDWPQVFERERKTARAFHLEDMEMLVAVQRGLKSKHYKQGRLSHLEEPVWLIQRYLAARYDDLYPQALEQTGCELDGWTGAKP